MHVSSKQMEAVLALPAARRFEHFIKVIADWEVVWGLYDDGWALAAADDGTTIFPLWPAKEYAQACAANEWSGHEPRAISLSEFMDELLPRLDVDGVLPGVFFTPSSRGITPTVAELRAALDEELLNY